MVNVDTNKNQEIICFIGSPLLASDVLDASMSVKFYNWHFFDIFVRIESLVLNSYFSKWQA
jgi:hypothetical protein